MLYYGAVTTSVTCGCWEFYHLTAIIASENKDLMADRKTSHHYMPLLYGIIDGNGNSWTWYVTNVWHMIWDTINVGHCSLLLFFPRTKCLIL